MADAIVTVTMNPALDVSSEVAYVVPEGKLRCRDPQFDPGGGGVNVSRAIKNLGGESMAILPVGGASGELVRQLLEAERVSLRAIPIRRATRENFNVTERSTGRQFRFCMPGPRVEPEEWAECLSAIEGLDPFPLYVVASGSLPPGVPADFTPASPRFAESVRLGFSSTPSENRCVSLSRRGSFSPSQASPNSKS